MERQQAVDEFAKELKKTLNIAALFPTEHPLFSKAIQYFKNNLDGLLPFANPLKIGVTPESLLVENRLCPDGVYGDLARHLHLRRVQSIEVRQGVRYEELLTLFSCLARHPKELLAAGGVQRLLQDNKVENITVAELDYSQLLKGSGSECKDVWIYLLGDAVEKGDTEKVEALAANFGKMLNHFRIKDILENTESKENIYKFLQHLKESGKESFFACAKEISRAILRGKGVLSTQVDLERIKMFFDGLTDADWAHVLSEGLIEEEGLDSLSFGLFAKLLDIHKHERIASLTHQAIQSKPVQDAGKLAKNITRLLSASQHSPVSQVYQNTLGHLLQDVSFTNTESFDRPLLLHNYAYILLNLVEAEEDGAKLALLLEKVQSQLDDIIRKHDTEYIKNLLPVLKKKAAGRPDRAALFEKPQRQIYTFIEHSLFEDALDEPFQQFADDMVQSSLGIDFYLDKIFEEQYCNATILKLYVRFFPGELEPFYKHLERKVHDMSFMERFIGALAAVEAAPIRDILKYIYTRSHNFVKREVLIAMQKQSVFDTEFLLTALSEDDISLKKEALMVLRRDDQARRMALEKLLLIKNPWGMKNKLLLENIIVVEEVGLKAAADYLIILSKKKFLWTWRVAKKAAQVLKKWAR
jgi:hypothetical protein